MKDFSKLMAGVFLCLITEALLVEITKRFSVKVGHDALIERLRMILVFMGLASLWLERVLARRADRKTAPMDTTADRLQSADTAQKRNSGSRPLFGICGAVGIACMVVVLVSMFVNAS